jgi:hypothetical protein
MLEFSQYSKIKDHYCICYFGPSDTYLLQLKLLKPVMERHFEGLKIFIGCRDEKINMLSDCQDVLKVTELKSRRCEFAHINELRFDMKNHPVEQFMIDTGIKDWTVDCTIKPEHSRKAVIIATGEYPTRNLEVREIEQQQRFLKSEGYDVEVNQSINGAGLVVGVESHALFEAASKGVRTRLIPRGVGTRLYKQMFKDAVVLHN